MRQLIDVEVFIRVVTLGSYARAAEAMGISRSHASRMVSGLEERLGVRLLHRTTRRVSTTLAGQRFYDSAAPLLAGLVEAEANAAAERSEPQGRVRLTMPTSLGLRYLCPALQQLRDRHPRLELEVDCSDRRCDIVEEGFDLAVRGGATPGAQLVQRRLWSYQEVLVCSPGLAAQAGALSQPEDLLPLPALVHISQVHPRHWQLSGPGERAVQVNGLVHVDNSETLMQAAEKGMGVALLPDFIVRDSLKAGRLVQILPDWGRPGAVWLLRPNRAQVPARVQLVGDFIASLGGAPPWAQAADLSLSA